MIEDIKGIWQSIQSKPLNVKIAGAIVGSLTLLTIAWLIFGGSEIKNAVRENLKDSGSAKFGTKIVSKDGNRACIEWNAKNEFGGYGDGEIAELKKVDNVWIVTDMEGFSFNCDDIAFAILDAKDAAELEADRRFEKLLENTPRFSKQDTFDLMDVSGECSDAASKYRDALRDDAEYKLRIKLNEYSEGVHADLKGAFLKIGSIENSVKSGNCQIE